MRRYYEFALAVMLIGLLSLVLMQALQWTRRPLEEAGVQAEAAAIRAELLERLAHRETFGGALPGSDNPLDWTAARPANYLGVRDSVPQQTGVWFFDTRTGELCYRFYDGRRARFRLSRQAGTSDAPGVLAGVGLLRLPDQFD